LQSHQEQLEKDKNELKKIFSTARSNNWCDEKDIPEIVNPLKKTKSRRATFTPEEYEKLIAYMRKWVDSQKREYQNYTRERLRYRVMVMYHTGMRTIESSNLKWKDIDVWVDDDGTEYANLWVQGKDKRRELIAKRIVTKLLNTWKQEAKYTKDDDYVFAIEGGKRPTNDHMMFDKCLGDIKLQEDRHGQNRTLSSLRHSYATNQIIDNKIDIVLLAKNMDTGIDKIEEFYGHHDTKTRAVELAGRGTGKRKKPTAKQKKKAVVRRPNLKIVKG